MTDIVKVLVKDLVNKYSGAEAFELDDGDLRFLERQPGGVLLGLSDEDGPVTRRFLISVTELPAPPTGTRALLQRLANNLKVSGEYGWEEEPGDRQVTINDKDMEISTTFAHDDDRGGRQRFTKIFTIDGDKLTDDNGNDCPLDDEASLQAFVNDCVSYHED
jgi:hypothetical protein